MAKQRPTDKRPTRKQLARREREERAQRWLLISAITIGAVVLVILGYGLVTELIIKAQRPVARVGEVAITTKDFKARQTYERWLTELQIYQYQSYIQQLTAAQAAAPTPEAGESSEAPVDDGTNALIQQLQIQLSSMQSQLSADMASSYAENVLNSMVEEELVRQEAAARGLTVTDAEVEERIGLIIGYNPEAETSPTETVTSTETITATATPATPTQQQSYDELYKLFKTDVLQITNYAEKDFVAMVRASLLADRLRTEFLTDVETVADQIEGALFSVGTDEAARALQERLNNGEVTPEALIDELTNDNDDTSLGFSLPWLPAGYLAGQMGPEIEQAAFNTPVGQASEPVPDADGTYYYVVYVTGHEEREVSEDILAQAGDQAYQDWLASAKETSVAYLDWEDAVVTQ